MNPTQATEFYVSLEGADGAPGTRERPFASLARAQAAVRQASQAGGARVIVRGGTYYLDQTLVFGPDDGGTGRPVTYVAYPGERVTLSGGWRVPGGHTSAASGSATCPKLPPAT